MKKIFLLPMVLLLWTSCSDKEAPKQESQLEKRHRELVKKTIAKNEIIADYRDYLNSVSNIVESMVSEQRGVISTLDTEVDKADPLMSHLDILDKVLSEQRYQLSLMEEKVHDQDFNLSTLRQHITQMELSLQAKELDIQQLLDSIADQQICYDMVVDQLDLTYDSLDLVVDQQNTAYFTFGTFKELEANNVLEKKGGILGIGSVKQLKANFNPEYFMPLDIREVREIPIRAESPKLVSSHPAGSYKLVGEEDNSSLVITDPEEFWKLTKHLAIVVK